MEVHFFHDELANLGTWSLAHQSEGNLYAGLLVKGLTVYVISDGQGRRQRFVALQGRSKDNDYC